ncbi:MAG: hypothetical protein M3R49_02550 [Chloroflexota bacterium]|nr:hypothetical protein [Chloroflexota bacterium]
MNDLDGLRRVALVGVVLAVVIGVPSSLAFFAAYRWDLEAALFGDPSAIIGGGPTAATFLHWGAIGDMLFSYLLLVPLVLYLHARLRPRKPWLADLGTIGALAYIFVGASGAAILAAVGPALIEAYATAAPTDRVAIATSFELLRNVVFFGLWQTLDTISLGIWILSVGWLIRPDRKVLGLLLVALAVGCLATSVQTMLGLHALVALAIGLGVPLLASGGWVVAHRLNQRK